MCLGLGLEVYCLGLGLGLGSYCLGLGLGLEPCCLGLGLGLGIYCLGYNTAAQAASDLIDMVVPVSHLTGRCHLHVRLAQGGLFRRTSITDGVWFGDQLAVFRPNFVQIVNFVFRPKC